MLNAIDKRSAAGAFSRGETFEFRLLLGFALVLFFLVAVLSRLLPRAWRPLAAGSDPGESVFAEAKRTAYTVIPLAFMR